MVETKGSIIKKADIVNGLRALGLKEGDLVVVHSSLSSFGYVEGGADAVIDALIDTVGENGTVVMPTFPDGRWYKPPYNPQKVPSNLGRISDIFRQRPGVMRSIDCFMAAVGPKALEILTYNPLPPGRPRHNRFYKIAELGGYILLIGVGQNRNSTLHTAQALAIEEVEGVEIDIYEAGGGYEFLDFDSFDEPLRESGLMQINRIGGSSIRLIDSRGLYELVRKMYEQSDDFRMHTKEYLRKISEYRLDVLSQILNLSEAQIQEAVKMYHRIQSLRWALSSVSDRLSSTDRVRLKKLTQSDDLQAFADQLQGSLENRFGETMKALRNIEGILKKYF